MKLIITINTDNVAFEEWPDMEANSILTKLSHRMSELFEDREAIPLYDSYGNKVGKAVLR